MKHSYLVETIWLLFAACLLASASPVPRSGTEPIPKLMAESSLVCKGEVTSAPDVKFVDHPERFTGTATVLIDRCFKGTPQSKAISVLFDEQLPSAGGSRHVILRTGDYRLYFLSSQNGEFMPVDDFSAVSPISRLSAVPGTANQADDPMALLEQDLKAGLRDPDKERVLDSIRMLGNMKHLQSTAALRKLLVSPDLLVKTYVMQALLRLQDYSVLPKVAEFLDSQPDLPPVLVLPRDRLLAMQGELAGGIGGIRDPRALPFLERFAQSKNQFVRMDAIDALRAINSPHSAPAFLKELDDPNLDNAFSAMHGLIELAGGGAIPWVPDLLQFRADQHFYAAKCREWWKAEGEQKAATAVPKAARPSLWIAN